MSALLSGELRGTADLRSLVVALDAFVPLEVSSVSSQMYCGWVRLLYHW